MTARHLAVRALSGVARSAATAMLVAVMVVASVLVHLDLPVIRRMAAARVNQLVFEPLFRGKMVIVGLGHVDPFGVADVSVRVQDPSGQAVLAVDGLASRIDLVTLLRTLAGGPNIVIDLPDVSIRNVDIRLDIDARGVAIANAFFPRPSPEPEHPSTTPGRGVRLSIPHVQIRHTWLHGLIPGVPYLDADVTDLDAGFSLEPARLAADMRKGRVVARGIALGADADGALEGHYELALDGTLKMGGHAAWEGTAGQLRGKASAGLADGRFDATVDVPVASPEAIRSLWPTSPIVGTGAAHVEAHGPLDAIALVAHATLGPGSVDVQGALRWATVKGARIHIATGGVDLREVASAIPPSSVGLTGNVEASIDANGRLEGHASLDVPSGHVGAHAIPHATLETSGFRAATGAFGGDAEVVIEEPGAPTTLSLHAVPRGDSSSVDFNLVSHAVRIGALRRMSTDATGNVQVLGKGNIDLDKLSVDVALDTHGDTLKQRSLGVGGLAIQGRVHGRLQNPDVDLALRARGVTWGATTLTELDVTARGRGLAPHVTVHEESPDIPDIDGAADVDVLDGPTVRHADIRVARLGETARVQVERARFERGAVAVDGMRIEGLGAPVTASFEIAGRSGRVSAQAARLDLGRLAKLVSLEQTIHGGTLRVELDGSVGESSADGAVRIKLEQGAIRDIDTITGHLDGVVQRRRFVGTAGIHAGDMGWFELDAKQLEIGATTVATFVRRTWGDVHLAGQVDLAKLAGHLPAETLPFDARGTVEVKGRFQRDNARDFTPLVELDATTSGLVLGAKRADGGVTEKAQRAKWTVEEVDVATTARVNGDTGLLELSAHVHDRAGDLAVIDGRSAAIPYRALYEAPGNALPKLLGTAFTAHIALPRRAVGSWPAFLGRPPVGGDLEADVAVEGPVLAPHVVVSAHLASVANAFARLGSPLDLDLHGTYEDARADVELHGREASKEVFVAEAHGSVRASDVVAMPPDLAWSASGKVHVDGFPLAEIGALDDRQVRGRITGDVEVDGLHSNATGRALLSVTGLKVGDTAYSKATATLRADGKSVGAEVHLDQDGGFAVLTATVPATWGAALLPAPDPQTELHADLQAKHFRAAAVLPFVRSSVDELDGFIDADAHVTADPRTGKIHAQGTAGLRDGLFQVADFGGELHDITANLTLTPDGILTLDHTTAHGVSGEVLVAATAHLDGLRLEAANATLEIPKSQGIPLTIGGALFGTVDGKVEVSEALSADRRTLNVKVDVPSLHLNAPEKGSQDVQTLGPIPGVAVGVQKSGTFTPEVQPAEAEAASTATAARPSDAPAVHVATHLGSDVVLRRGSDVRVELTGGPAVTIADKVRVSEQLQLKGGFFSLYGKKFEIEHGTVTFVGDDAANPQVSVSAVWTASDGTRVIADFVGPLKTGKVTLRSEPALTQNDIVQLLLFGAVQEGQAASAQGATPPGASAAEGVAGSIATQPLNRALDQFGLSAVSARVDTSSVNAKPELVVQIAKDISLQLAYILFIGPPPPGTSPDTTLLTVDWRFLRKWSLDATVGNAGTTIVDLVWKYRY